MSYERTYRTFGFTCFGMVDLIFSVALSRSLGLTGLILPTMLIAIAYLTVECLLDLIIYWLDNRNRSERRNSRS